MKLLFPQTPFKSTSLNEEDKSKFISEVSNYRDELASTKNIPKERLNFISHKLLILESSLGTRVRTESFKENYQEDLLYRAENMVAAGIAGIIAMLLAFFLNKDSGSSGGGGGGGGRSTETLTKQAEVKADKKVEKAKKTITDSGEVTVVIENPGYYPDSVKTMEDFGKIGAHGISLVKSMIGTYKKILDTLIKDIDNYCALNDDDNKFNELKRAHEEDLIVLLNAKGNTDEFKDKYELPVFDCETSLSPIGFPIGDTHWTKTPFTLVKYKENSVGEVVSEVSFERFESKNPCQKNNIVLKFPTVKDNDLKEMYKFFRDASDDVKNMLKEKDEVVGDIKRIAKLEKEFRDGHTLKSKMVTVAIKAFMKFVGVYHGVILVYEDVFLHLKTLETYLACVMEIKTDSDGNFVI